MSYNHLLQKRNSIKNKPDKFNNKKSNKKTTNGKDKNNNPIRHKSA